MSLADLLRLPVHNLIASCSNVSMLAHQFALMLQDDDDVHYLKGRTVFLLQSSVELIGHAGQLVGIVTVVAAAKRCTYYLSNFTPHGNDFRAGDSEVRALLFELQHLSQSVADELESRQIYFLPPASAAWLDPNTAIVSQDVERAFPRAMEDLRESASCLAFGRYTAAVFHLMRGMESAVQTLAAKVGVAQVEKEWGKLLSDISKAIESMPKGGERDRWSESHSHLYHVKQAWRNDTMHPKTTYTEAEAKAVFEAVRSFMTHLAALV